MGRRSPATRRRAARSTDTIRAVLTEAGVGIDADALAWVSDQLGADRVSTRGEAEKLALYVGPGGRVDLDAAMACVGDLAGLSLDDALFAATEGDVARADRALELALAEGATPVGVLRAGLMHLQRLHRVRLAVDEGLSAADAVKGARPPVFFRRVGAFSRAFELWSSGGADGGDGRHWPRRNAPASAPARRTTCCRATRCWRWRAVPRRPRQGGEAGDKRRKAASTVARMSDAVMPGEGPVSMFVGRTGTARRRYTGLRPA